MTQILIKAPDGDVSQHPVLSDLHQVRVPYVGEGHDPQGDVWSEIGLDVNDPVYPSVTDDTVQCPPLCDDIWKLKSLFNAIEISLVTFKQKVFDFV